MPKDFGVDFHATTPGGTTLRSKGCYEHSSQLSKSTTTFDYQWLSSLEEEFKHSLIITFSCFIASSFSLFTRFVIRTAGVACFHCGNSPLFWDMSPGDLSVLPASYHVIWDNSTRIVSPLRQLLDDKVHESRGKENKLKFGLRRLVLPPLRAGLQLSLPPHSLLLLFNCIMIK